MDKDYSCNLCALSFNSKSDFILHRISSPHIKKLKTEFLQHGFLVHCLACDICLSDLKQADAHMQQSQHKDQFRTFLNKGQSIKNDFSCESCGLLFTNRLGYEVHRTLPPHEMEINLSNLPDFFQLVRHLGGLPDGSTWRCCCKVCNEDYGRLDELVVHLFSKLHIHRLRQSKCILCLKDFIHASDRESHLASARHKSHMSFRANKLLTQVQANPICTKQGYLCMYCMVWCSSWPCFELHLLDDIHQAVSSKAKHNQLQNIALTEVNATQGKKCFSYCNKSISIKWKIWNMEPAGLSGWCHLCGIVVDSPDMAESHLEEHKLGKISKAEEKHAVVAANDSTIPDVYQCYACAMSFKSNFSLDVHEAMFQHHLRVAATNSIANRYWCRDCGMDVNGANCMQEMLHDKGEAELLTTNSELVLELEKQVTGPCLDEIIEHKSEPIGEDAGNEIREIQEEIVRDQCSNPVVPCAETGACIKSEDSPSLQNNCPKKLPGSLTKFSSHLAAAPIIAAATFAQPESLQEALYSVMTMVTDSLAATIPMLQVSSTRDSRKHMQEACKANVHAGKRLCLGQVGLEAALREGFKSVHSAPSFSDRMTDTRKSDGAASVVVATSTLSVQCTSGFGNNTPDATADNVQKQEPSGKFKTHITKS